MFTLKKFSATHKNTEIYNCDFVSGVEEREEIFTTLILGENGAGKSYLLKIISDFIRSAEQDFKAALLKYDSVELEYSINRDNFLIKKSKKEFLYYINGKQSEHSKFSFPSSILALSFMVNDKFTYSHDLGGFYKYLGVRASSNATYTSSIQKKILDSLINSIRTPQKLEALKKVINFIGFKNDFEIYYILKRKTLASKGVSEKQLLAKINSISKRKKYVGKSIISNLKNSTDIIIEFINKLRDTEFLNENKMAFKLDVNNIENSFFLSNIELIELLEELEFISSPNILFKKEDAFGFEYTSSGEKHLFFTMLNLISYIEFNSLILIDEPELSLHPYWQMRYIRLVKEITKEFRGSHILLASHSHFLVSGLPHDTSSLLTMKTKVNDEKIYRECELIEHSTYAWSAENILYTVFGLRTTRNYYFEMDLARVLTLISKRSKEYQEIREIYQRIKSLSFHKDDPLNKIIFDVETYLEEGLND